MRRRKQPVVAPHDRPVPTAREGEPLPVRQVLPNGLRLIVQDHRAADIVAVYLYVGVGVRYEKPDQLGFAHFQEHMLFKGTDKWGPGYIDRAVEGVGGRTNATTSFDYTDFYLVVPADALETAVQTLADMAFRSTFDPKEVDRERQVIFEEANIQADNPRTAIVRNIYSLVFADNPYGYPPLRNARNPGRGDERQAQGVQPALLHAAEHDAGRGRPRRGREGAGPGRSHLRDDPRHGLPGRTRAGAPAARRYLAPDGGARGATGRSSRWAGKPRAPTMRTATPWIC